MRLTDAWKVKVLLQRIKEPDSFVAEALALIDREIAIRERMANRGRDNKEDRDLFLNN